MDAPYRHLALARARAADDGEPAATGSDRLPLLPLLRGTPTGAAIAVRLAGAAVAVGLLLMVAPLTGDAARVLRGAGASIALFHGVLFVVAALCAARAVLVAGERAIWGILGFGIAAWTSGNLLWLTTTGGTSAPGGLSHALWLAFYPTAYVALTLLVRARVGTFTPGLWLDAYVAGTATAAAMSAVFLGPIIEHAAGSGVALALGLAYPVADLLVIAVVVAVFALNGWRPGRAWLMLLAGFALLAFADTVWFYRVALGTFEPHGLLDSLWPMAMGLLALASWQTPASSRPRAPDGWTALVVPALFTLGSGALLVWGNLRGLTSPAVGLAAASLAGGVLRSLVTLRDVQRLADTRRAALTDELTGLGNRRRLLADLERALPAGGTSASGALVLFDLDGFKGYNDAFGHAAGDDLLARLGGRLAAACAGSGSAYRLGGDEFCALLDAPASAELVWLLSDSLAERGDGFAITSSHGTVELPAEAQDPAAALRLADERMYARKHARPSAGKQQAFDVALAILQEQQPGLHEHADGVAQTARAVALACGLAAEVVDDVGRAAVLHDVGKIAIPRSLLDRPGPLDDDEWVAMRRHTLIGERMLRAAPSLRSVAALVRASHERFDGAGYPDGAAGEDIPLGARIIAVCDAYDAITGDRPYHGAEAPAAALAELRRCAGSQFDPLVVEAFVRVMEARGDIDADREELPRAA